MSIDDTTYLEDHLESVYEDKNRKDWINDVIIETLANDYDLPSMRDVTSERLMEIWSDVIEKVDMLILREDEEYLEREMYFAEREYAADMAVDRMKDPD